MTQFTKSFTWRFILRLLFVQLFVDIFLEWIVSGVEEATFWMIPFFVPYAIIVAIIDAIVVFLVAGSCFERISGTYCYEYPKQPDKWFRNFVLIICTERVILAVISFIQAMIEFGRISNGPDPVTQEVMDQIYNEVGITFESQQQLCEVISHLELRIIACYTIQIVVWVVVMYLLLNKLKAKYGAYVYKGPQSINKDAPE